MSHEPSDPRQVALITGGSRGIGRAVTDALLDGGWQVFVCSRRRDSLSRALDELRAAHPDRVSGWLCDVSDPDQVDEIVGRVLNEAGHLNCLVNNAGVGLFAPVDEIAPDDWRRALGTNLDGAFHAIRAVAPHMKQRGSGWIFNIVSLAARHPFARGAAYNASKAGLLALSEASMLDLRSHGIRVAAILPGSVRTDFGHPQPGSEDGWKLAPEDVARAVVDLLAYPDRALPSVVELRPTRPPGRS